MTLTACRAGVDPAGRVVSVAGATMCTMAEHVFEATVWEHSPDEPGSWHFLTLPGDVSDDIAAEAGPPAGFGSVRVVVTIGDTTWRTSLFPDTKAGSYLLPLKKQVRAAERLQAGDTCRVRLSPE